MAITIQRINFPNLIYIIRQFSLARTSILAFIWSDNQLFFYINNIIILYLCCLHTLSFYKIYLGISFLYLTPFQTFYLALRQRRKNKKDKKPKKAVKIFVKPNISYSPKIVTKKKRTKLKKKKSIQNFRIFFMFHLGKKAKANKKNKKQNESI